MRQRVQIAEINARVDFGCSIKRAGYPALFLDRDGVVNYDFGHVGTIDRFVFYDDIFEVIRAANQKNLHVIIVTNQAGIAKNFYSLNQFYTLTRWMITQLNHKNCTISAVLFCPAHEEGELIEFKLKSTYRKPESGLFFRAKGTFDIDLKKSIMIGDRKTDIIAAKSAGIDNVYDVSRDRTTLIKEVIERIQAFRCFAGPVETKKRTHNILVQGYT